MIRLAAALAISAAPLSAQDARILSADDHARWQAIGRVNIAGLLSTRLCTGALIAPDLVLTAAHCTFAHRPDTPHPAEEIHFVAGWFRGEYTAHSPTAEVILPNGWTPQGTNGADI
ncbi:MAG: trypsin-like serine protease, partial [Rhodobacteraceae bacterium]|nr:trypsin-like serine protease [Paracoccaceae bacterium]